MAERADDIVPVPNLAMQHELANLIVIDPVSFIYCFISASEAIAGLLT